GQHHGTHHHHPEGRQHGREDSPTLLTFLEIERSLGLWLKDSVVLVDIFFQSRWQDTLPNVTQQCHRTDGHGCTRALLTKRGRRSGATSSEGRLSGEGI